MLTDSPSGCNPTKERISDVLPAPFVPTTATTEPVGIAVVACRSVIDRYVAGGSRISVTVPVDATGDPPHRRTRSDQEGAVGTQAWNVGPQHDACPSSDTDFDRIWEIALQQPDGQRRRSAKTLFVRGFGAGLNRPNC